MAKVKNGKVNNGIPYGSMVPPKGLSTAFTKQSELESKLLVSREEIKRQTATFYTRFKSKFPKAGLADFARQFSKDVPFKRDEYKSNATYMALDNMFRYMPEVKTGGKTETSDAKEARIAKQKRETKRRKAQAQALRERAERLVSAICHQAGIPNALFVIAAQRCGFQSKEIESMWGRKDSLIDVGLGTFQLVVRQTGVPATKAYAKNNVKAAAAAQSIPTAAELANVAKSSPKVTTPTAPATPATTKAYKGKGQYQTVVLKAGDSVGQPNGHATR